MALNIELKKAKSNNANVSNYKQGLQLQHQIIPFNCNISKVFGSAALHLKEKSLVVLSAFVQGFY